MKKFFIPSPNPFLVDKVDVLTVSRDRGYEANHRNGREKHSFIYTEKGTLRYRFSNTSPMEATAGELVFLPKKTAHTTLYLQNGTHVKIIQFNLCKGTLPDYLSRPCKLELPNAGELIDVFFERVQPHPMRFLSLLYELFYRLDRERNRSPIKFKKLYPVMEELHAHPEIDRKIAYYAERCGMSEAGFRRLFREYTGASPIDYRNALRLERAHLLLGGGDYNVSEAAETVGFSNLSFFIRLYKRKYGHTPGSN